MKSLFYSLFVCSLNLLISTFTFSQSIHYFGLDTNYNHDPKDILLTSDGGFLINGDCNLAGSFIESVYTRQYYVKTNAFGDTLWTKYFNKDYSAFGNTSSMQSLNGNFETWGTEAAGYSCNGVGLSWPFSDLSRRIITPNGELVSNLSSDINCFDRVVDGKKKQVGMYLLIESKGAFNEGTSLRIYDFIDIGDVNFIQLVSTTPLPSNYLTQIEKAPNGYWLANNSKLYKVGYPGHFELWNTDIPSNMSLADFCRVDIDNLLFARSTNQSGYGDSVRLIKTDSAGVQIWNKKFFLSANQVFQHSSGNYIITGKNNNRASVLVVNSVGDSLWGKNYTLNMGSYGIKTIEYNNGKLATLAYSGGFGGAGKYALIIDTIDVLPNSGLIENNLNTKISIYPNPTSSTLSISGINSEFSYQITDLQGKTLKQGTNEKQIEIEHLPAGIYVIGIATDKDLKQLRFVKL
jgi:hypothetical protein